MKKIGGLDFKVFTEEIYLLPVLLDWFSGLVLSNTSFYLRSRKFDRFSFGCIGGVTGYSYSVPAYSWAYLHNPSSVFLYFGHDLVVAS